MRWCRTLNLMVVAVVFTLAAACYKPVANTMSSDDSGGSGDRGYAERGSTPEVSDDVGNDAALKDKEGDTGLSDSDGAVSGGFRANFEANLKRHGLERGSVVDENNPVEARILREYGAVFLTRATPPSKVMFTSDGEAGTFQSKAGIKQGNFGSTTIELQPAAMDAMLRAVEQASRQGLSISPRDGSEAGRRNYGKTLDLWNSRFLKACDHWRGKGRLTAEQVSRLKSLPIKQQVAEVLELEKTGIYFNTFFNNSILYSVAAPGTSQHISMLAFDVAEFKSPAVRRILADNGWFRTVQNDEPHFTYLGLKESDLPSYGLKKVTKDGGEYWIPEF